ncbi:MAG: ATP-dependent helicase C-terminal domain-containing protein [Vulcanimicrobiota bacterium]
MLGQIEARYAPSGFPVSECLDRLVAALKDHPLVALTAPPGSGKTLLVPAALLARSAASRVLVLEPRRVTARLPALALREVCGPLVGYQIRLERQWDEQKTRIGYLTYGTALRVFCNSPPSPDEIVVFDEFHERQWEAELLLAYLRSLSRSPRLLLMSATLDRAGLPLDTPVVESEGRLHRVTISHEKIEPQLLSKTERLASLVADRSAEWAVREKGEQLIFLPGLSEIRAVQEKLLADPFGGPVEILHSSLPEPEIRRVVEQKAQGLRRILSTDLAESSVTLPGIKVVIDSGLVRRPSRDRLDLGVTLQTVAAPLSSLEQRAGRAGRLGPGFCHRLFSKQQELHREPFARPQIEEAEYKTVCLFLASMELLEGWKALPWLWPPVSERLARAREWAGEAGLLSGFALTARGREVLGLPLEPRLAGFAVSARLGGQPVEKIVKWCQALERPPGGKESWALEDWAPRVEIDQRLQRTLQDRLQALKPGKKKSLPEALLANYRDTIAMLTAERAVCANPAQPAMSLKTRYPVHKEPALLLSASPQGGAGPDSFCRLYQPIEADLLWEQMFDRFVETVELFYDPASRGVKLRREVALGSLVLESGTEAARPGPETARVLLQNLPQSELGEEFQTLQRRLELFRTHQPEQAIPEVEELLLSFLETQQSWSKNSPEQLMEHLQGLLPYPLMQALDRELPLTVRLPGRSRPVPVQYPTDGDPYVASKLQDFMGWKQPRLLGGKLPLVCRLLAPNGRPCQITTDLDAFWSGSYQQVRKDLRGRYPKHHWPEDPSRNPSR